MQYIVYKRVSSKQQGESGLGLEAQERDINLFLSNYALEGSQVLAEYVDILSGSSNDRPELIRALEHCRRERATLLVSKLDRLSRKVSYIATLIEDAKVSFRVAQMPHADKFQLHIYAALAEQERDFISKRTKAALQEAKARGVKLGGARDELQARHKAVKLQADRDAQRVASLMIPLRDAGKTLQQIADCLNSSGVTTARGSQWHPTSVRRTLKRVG